MKGIGEYLKNVKPQNPFSKNWKFHYIKKIIKAIRYSSDTVGLSKVYNVGYWLRKLKDFENRGGEEWVIDDFIRQIDKYPVTFNKGAILTNLLQNYGKPKTEKLQN